MEKRIFLAANSSEGFCSFFGDCYDPFDGWKAFLIKGGPGTGKSSSMRYFAKKFQKEGCDIVYCPCSSDPDSLDGVIVKDKKVIFLDATAPHIVEPKVPGVCETIINTGEFWDREKLYSSSAEIRRSMAKNKFYHTSASRYLSAAGQMLKENGRLVSDITDYDKADRFSEMLIKRFLKEKGKTGCLKNFFLTGITPKGIISFPETVTEAYQNVIILSDKYGISTNAIIKRIGNAAENMGYTVYDVKNPFLPSVLSSHLLIPELSFALVSENDFIKFGDGYRKIHGERFYDIKELKKIRNKLFFNRRISKELMLSASAALKNAKAEHDVLEKYYVDAMNFDAFWEWIGKYKV